LAPAAMAAAADAPADVVPAARRAGQRGVKGGPARMSPCLKRRWVVALALVACWGRLADADCLAKTDPHGLWEGSLAVGGNYTLTCNEGFSIAVGVETGVSRFYHKAITCQDNGVWDEDLACSKPDNCKALKHDCGQFGVCVSEVGGYHCNCEKGYPLLQVADGSGEWVCGSLEVNGACQQSTCGAHGICIDLSSKDREYETGNNSYRCSCEEGYVDNNFTCTAADCGLHNDDFGTWSGDTTYGGIYTLRCGSGSFVRHSFQRKVSISCGVAGIWPADMPHCINLWQEGQDAQAGALRFWIAVACATLCIIAAALAAGLTMGLVSIDPFDMKLLMNTRREDCNSVKQTKQLRREQSAASRISPLLKDHHKLLVTLLLLNSVANEALPIFLDQIVPSFLAVLISVTCVLFFGEVLPSAVFTGPSQLPIAAAFSPFVKCLQFVFMPLSLPIKTLLDHMVGHEEDGPKYTRAELKALIRLHRHDMIGRHDTDVEESHVVDDSDDESSQDASDLEKQAPYLQTSRTRLMENIEHEEQTDDNSPRGANDSGLTMVECTLAEQSLALSKTTLDSLASEQPLLFQPASTLQNSEQVLRMSSTTPVSKALAMLHVTPSASHVLVHEAGGVTIGTASREALLWAALMTTGFPRSQKPPP